MHKTKAVQNELAISSDLLEVLETKNVVFTSDDNQTRVGKKRKVCQPYIRPLLLIRRIGLQIRTCN